MVYAIAYKQLILVADIDMKYESISYGNRYDYFNAYISFFYSLDIALLINIDTIQQCNSYIAVPKIQLY